MNDLKALAAQKAAQEQISGHPDFSETGFPDLPEDSPELKTPTAEDIMMPEQKVVYSNNSAVGLKNSSISQSLTSRGGEASSVNGGSLIPNGDGGSSTSESSLGSSSGYGSQNTVRVTEDQNSHHPTLTAVHDGKDEY